MGFANPMYVAITPTSGRVGNKEYNANLQNEPFYLKKFIEPIKNT